MGLKDSVTALGCRPNTENVTMQHRNIHTSNTGNIQCKFSEYLYHESGYSSGRCRRLYVGWQVVLGVRHAGAWLGVTT